MNEHHYEGRLEDSSWLANISSGISSFSKRQLHQKTDLIDHLLRIEYCSFPDQHSETKTL